MIYINIYTTIVAQVVKQKSRIKHEFKSVSYKEKKLQQKK